MVATTTWVVLILYFLLLIGIGFYSSKRSSGGLTDFFLAGRGLNKWTVALSAVSSGRSSWLILGVTGTAYIGGLQAVWALAGFITVEVFMFFFLARRFRRFSQKYNAITIPDILEKRFADKTHILRIVSALILVFFMVAYVGSQIVGGGVAFSSTLGFSQTGGMWFMAAILLFYTVVGGFFAVSRTDVLQAGFMMFSLILLPLIAIISIGGLGAVFEMMQTQGAGFVDPFYFSFGAIIGLLGIGFGSPGNPQILVRYMSLKNVKEMRQAALISTFWNVLMGWGAVMTGLSARVYFPDVELLPNANQETAFTALGAEVLPPILFGVMVVAVLAAIMSSADSQLLVGASSLVRDIYSETFGRGKVISDERLVWYSRLAIIIIMGLAIVLAFQATELVFWMVLFAFGGLGACFGPALVLSLYWRGLSKAGVLSGMIVGLIVVILVKQQPEWTMTFLPNIQQLLTDYFFGITYEAVPAFLASLLVTVIVSLFTKKPEFADEMLTDLESGTKKA